MSKKNLYDYSVCVPLLVMGPGILAGEQRDALCYLIDIFPTLCDLTNHPIPPSVEGQSLLPVLADATVFHRDYLHFAYTDLQRGVSNGRFKLIEYAVDGIRTTQLFDCQTDPWELNNLADDPSFTEIKAQLHHELLRWRTELGDWGDVLWETYEKEESNEYE